jgi:formylglycine-generating enzyme required for sulfatase activity
MLLQRAGTGTIPPAGFMPPPWVSLAASWDSSPQPPSSAIRLGPATVSVGHNDLEADDANPKKAFSLHDFEYGWDNEHPKKEVHVDEFKIEWRPVTNGQFYKFYVGEGQGKVQFPASWVEQGGEVMVGSFGLLVYLDSNICLCRSVRCMARCR